ncbi:rod shape-determining protein MreC [Clostridiisalibacter paucivorans]|uniref:rod shape-determining protein MreC n=1 Tax=Clostridiisalibacter paucivorans TaxID=408753 RepID=UPI00047B7BC6|nr:rod shape-determining protein MreC [Clostridiisalibacter paucivorans]
MSIFKKYGSKMIVTGVAIILLVIIGISSHNRGKTFFIENKFVNIITPIQKVVYNFGESISNNIESLRNLGNLKEENERLKKEIVSLKENNRILDNVVSKYDFLENEAVLKKNSNYTFVDAQVTAKDSGNWFNNFVIDKGANDGIKKDDVVVQGVKIDGNIVKEGLVGRVIEVGDNWSKVLSIIDIRSNISFKVIRTQDNGVVSGEMDNQMEGFLFDEKADIVKGDKLVTSGLGEVFIPDMYIGVVSKIEKKNDELIKNIIVEPAIDFKKINDVFVIINQNK